MSYIKEVYNSNNIPIVGTPSDLELTFYLKELGEARSSHLRWRALAQSLILGSHNISDIALSHDKCKFGLWYYSQKEGSYLHSLQYFRDLEYPHITLHSLLSKIKAINDVRSSCLSSLIYSPEELHAKKIESSSIFLGQLLVVSSTFLLQIDLLEKFLTSSLSNKRL